MVILTDRDKELVTMVHKQCIKKLCIIVNFRAELKHISKSDEYHVVYIFIMLPGN